MIPAHLLKTLTAISLKENFPVKSERYNIELNVKFARIKTRSKSKGPRIIPLLNANGSAKRPAPIVVFLEIKR